MKIHKWIEDEMIILEKIKEKPTRINVEATAQEINTLNEILQNVNEKITEISELVLDDSSDKFANNLDVLTNEVNRLYLNELY